MKNLPRYHSKKEWRTHIEKCWTVQDNLHKCIVNSEEFLKLSLKSRDVVTESVSKGFLYDYIYGYMNGKNNFSLYSKFFYDRNSALWENNQESLNALDEKCNLFSLYDCAEQTFNLENLEGSYEFAKRFYK